MSWSMMFPSISATQAAVVPSTSILFPPPPFKTLHTGSSTRPSSTAGLVIECSSRPQKKATAHHMKTRPRKTQAWDIKRKPTVYAPLPPLPPDWTLASDAAVATAGDLEAGLQSPTATG